jgi:hypothetical protein
LENYSFHTPRLQGVYFLKALAMNDTIQRNAANILAISLLLLSGATSAQPNKQTVADEKKTPTDQTERKADKENLRDAKKSVKQDKASVAKDKEKTPSDNKK